jgi:hypothetical protein
MTLAAFMACVSGWLKFNGQGEKPSMSAADFDALLEANPVPLTLV